MYYCIVVVAMDNITLIATFYNVKPFLPAALKYQPRKVVLLVDDDGRELKENIKSVKKTFGEIVQFEMAKMSKDDIFAIAKAMVDLIDKNKAPGTRIVVSVGGGSRSLANAALLGCYARPDRVFKIVSNGMRDNEVISLPKLSYNIGSTKRELLVKMQDRRNRTILQIAKEMRKTRGMIYQHLKELKDHGYLDDDYNITDAGKLALL